MGQFPALVFEGGLKRDTIESLATAAECNGPHVVNNDAWSGATANAEDTSAAANGATHTHKSGV